MIHDPPTQPKIQLQVATQRTAQEQYWRHVANRTCLAILADHRTPLGMARLTKIPSTRGRDQAGSKRAGSEVFDVHVEPVQFSCGERMIITAPLRLEVLVAPSGEANVRTLASLRMWPTPQSAQVLFRYGRERRQLIRKDGLSGDVVFLFEQLLKPHTAQLWAAMQLEQEVSRKTDQTPGS